MLDVPALARIGIGDRTRVDERLLERLRRRDVGRARAVADGDADADASKIGAASRRHLFRFLELRHQRRRGDDQVGRLAGRDDGAQLSGRADLELEFVAGLPRVVRDDARDQAAHGAGGDDLDVGGARWSGKEKRERNRKARDRGHGNPPGGAYARLRGLCHGLPDHFRLRWVARAGNQACPASVESMPRWIPIFFSALSYLLSVSPPKINSASAEQCSQPLCWISLSSWPGAQPA